MRLREKRDEINELAPSENRSRVGGVGVGRPGGSGAERRGGGVDGGRGERQRENDVKTKTSQCKLVML